MVTAYIDLAQEITLAITKNNSLEFWQRVIDTNNFLNFAYAHLSLIPVDRLVVVLNSQFSSTVFRNDGISCSFDDIYGNVSLTDVQKMEEVAKRAGVKQIDFVEKTMLLHPENDCIVIFNSNLRSTAAVYKNSKFIYAKDCSAALFENEIMELVLRFDVNDVISIDSYANSVGVEKIRGIPTQGVTEGFIFESVLNGCETLSLNDLINNRNTVISELGELSSEVVEYNTSEVTGRQVEQENSHNESEEMEEEKVSKPARRKNLKQSKGRERVSRKEQKRRNQKPEKSRKEKKSGSILGKIVSYLLLVLLIVTIFAGALLWYMNQELSVASAQAAAQSVTLQTELQSLQTQVNAYKRIQNNQNTLDNMSVVTALTSADLIDRLISCSLDGQSITLVLSSESKDEADFLKRTLESYYSVELVEMRQIDKKIFYYTFTLA